MWKSASSSVTQTPPSMVEMWWQKKVLKVPIGPNVPARAAAEARAHGLSQLSSIRVIVPAGDQPADGVEVVGVAEQIDREDHVHVVVEGPRQRREIEVQRLAIDVDEAQDQAVLAERIVGGRPGDRRHDRHPSGSRQRRARLEQGGHGQQVGGGAAVDHHRVPRAHLGGEGRSKARTASPMVVWPLSITAWAAARSSSPQVSVARG